MVTVLKNIYTPRYYEFALDSVSELDLLPTTQKSGKEYLATISSCCSGSYAHINDSDYTEFVLNGITDEWTLFRKSGGSGTDGLTMEIVNTVPTVATASPNIIYLVDSDNDGSYEQYVLVTIGGENKVISLGSKKEIVVLTQAEYDALTEIDPEKLYFIKDVNN